MPPLTPSFDLDAVASRIADRLGPRAECSIIVRDGTRLALAGRSHERAGRCDAVEVLTGEGPCVDAADTLRAVVVPELPRETRWTSWRDTAVAEGFVSAAALPAVVDEQRTVAVNLYSELLDPWSLEMLLGMDAYAQTVADAVRQADRGGSVGAP